MTILKKSKDNINKLISNFGLDQYDIANIIAIFVLFAILLYFSWAKWGHIVVDCGRELYVAEFLLQGKRLYTDIYYLYGSIMPYVFSLLFIMFGKNLLVAYITGIILTIVFLISIYLLTRNVLPKGLTLLLMIILLLLLVFNPYGLGIFNYIFPYTYSALLGSVLTTLFLLMLALNIRSKKLVYLYAAAIIAAISLINKIEYGYPVTVIFLIYLACGDSFSSKIPIKSLFKLLSILVAIPAITILLLFIQSGWNNILHYLKYNYYFFICKPSIHFFFEYFNKNLPSDYYKDLLINVLCFLGILLITILLSSIYTRILPRLKAGFYLILITISVYIILGQSSLAKINSILYSVFTQVLYYSPYLALIFILFYIYKHCYRKTPATDELKIVFLIAINLFLISTRFNININIEAYGTYYSYLAFILLFYFIKQMGKPEYKDKIILLIFKNFLIGSLCFLCVSLTSCFYNYYNNKSYCISTNRGTIYTNYNIGPAINQLMNYIQTHTTVKEKIVLLPEETLVYFLINRQFPNIFYDSLPFRLYNNYLRTDFIKTLRDKKVSFIALSNRSTPEYIYKYWGVDYNKDIMKWIENHYEYCGSFGKYQTDTSFYQTYGIKIYQKKCPYKW